MVDAVGKDGYGKGWPSRPVNKEKYDRGYLRVFGVKCPTCNGNGWVYKDTDANIKIDCPTCNSVGYIEKEK